MRKMLAIWLLFSLLFGIAPVLALAEGTVQTGMDTVTYAKVATQKGTLNMRKEANDKAEVLQKLAKGTIVQVLEENGDWTQIQYKKHTGYVMTSFLEMMDSLPYTPLSRGDKSEAVLTFKRAMHKLEYLKADEINSTFDLPMELALTRMQLMNGVALDPQTVSPELQALLAWDLLVKGKSGYLDTATDKDSGLMVSIFCWDIGGTLYEEDQAVKVKIAFAAQAAGGMPPYTVTVRKSLSGSGGEREGDEVSSPFSHIWTQSTDRVYVYATAVDAAGNTVTAVSPFRYTLPARYTGGE